MARRTAFPRSLEPEGAWEDPVDCWDLDEWQREADARAKWCGYFGAVVIEERRAALASGTLGGVVHLNNLAAMETALAVGFLPRKGAKGVR